MTDGITVSKFWHTLAHTTTTTTPLLDGCSDKCGWMAAGISLLAYGTYGVPIKETKHLPQLNPLVFQSYKTCTMFVLAPIVVTILDGSGAPWRYSPWGLLSGLLWVLGGTGGVVSVRWCGMAMAVGTWASVMICVNFVWGLLIFAELARNRGRLWIIDAGLDWHEQVWSADHNTDNRDCKHHVVELCP
jgi:hypothetical protein